MNVCVCVCAQRYFLLSPSKIEECGKGEMASNKNNIIIEEKK
jgi:hypothetical protein